MADLVLWNGLPFYERWEIMQGSGEILSLIMRTGHGNREDLLVWRPWNSFLRKICFTWSRALDFLPEICLMVSPHERPGTPLEVVKKS